MAGTARGRGLVKTMVYCQILGAEVTFLIDISPLATILDLKQRIEEGTGVQVARQTLRTLVDLANGSRYAFQLQDEKIVAYYINTITTTVLMIHLNVVPLPIHLEVNILIRSRTTRTKAIMKVKETNTVAELKYKIYVESGVHYHHLVLCRMGQEMRNDHPLSKYYINEGSIVEVGIISPI